LDRTGLVKKIAPSLQPLPAVRRGGAKAGCTSETGYAVGVLREGNILA
jgi:hypothetical protein